MDTKDDFVLVTQNWTDFRNLVGTRDDLEVIEVPRAWTTRQVDTKLTALLRSHAPAGRREGKAGGVTAQPGDTSRSVVSSGRLR